MEYKITRKTRKNFLVNHEIRSYPTHVSTILILFWALTYYSSTMPHLFRLILLTHYLHNQSIWPLIWTCTRALILLRFNKILLWPPIVVNSGYNLTSGPYLGDILKLTFLCTHSHFECFHAATILGAPTCTTTFSGTPTQKIMLSDASALAYALVWLCTPSNSCSHLARPLVVP